MSTPEQPTSTRLDAFIRRHRIDPKALADKAGVTLNSIDHLRRDDGNPTLTTMRTIRDACAELAGVQVAMTELFDLGED